MVEPIIVEIDINECQEQSIEIDWLKFDLIESDD